MIERGQQAESEEEQEELNEDSKNFLGGLSFINDAESEDESDVESFEGEPTIAKRARVESDEDFDSEDENFDTAELEKFALQQLRQ